MTLPGFLGGQRDPDRPPLNGLAIGGLVLAILGTFYWLYQGSIWPGGVMGGCGAVLGQVAISQIEARKQPGRTLATFAVGIGASVAIMSVTFSLL